MITGNDENNACDAGKKTQTYNLPAELTIENIEALSNDLKKLATDNGIALTLDASQTETITTPGVQLLLSLDKLLSSNGGKLIIYQSKGVLNDTFSLLGLNEQLAKWH